MVVCSNTFRRFSRNFDSNFFQLDFTKGIFQKKLISVFSYNILILYFSDAIGMRSFENI